MHESMEQIAVKIPDSVGPRWTQLHSLLGLAGLQRKISITANNNSVTPERVRYRYYALETIRDDWDVLRSTSLSLLIEVCG